ncbi:MAG TPA: hypothetical protein VK464_10920 [Symbiobacteriaceae bacterium]|nr:hypothetical protein [Symbiobacteriaceae bacterium]
MIRSLVAGALRGISHPNTDLDAQTFLLRVRQLRAAAGLRPDLEVSYQPQVTEGELDDPQVLVWDIGRSHDPARGNFDHHQDHRLGATPIILLQALGQEPSPLDRYVDLADRGIFFREPQPLPYVETLQGFSHGINILHGNDAERSNHFHDLLTWVEESGADPFGRFDRNLLPARFHPFVEARLAEEAVALGAAAGARWFNTRIGKVAYVAAKGMGVMRVLYDQGAALVILHEPEGRMSGWSRPADKYTVGANPALVAVPEALDLRPLFVRLATLEPSGHPWGGQAGIGGSPREEGGSGLSAEQVVREVTTYLG